MKHKDMGKAWKKIIALVVMAIMVVSMSAITAFAGDGSITINGGVENDQGTHDYKAYQVFKGDLSTNDDGDKVLSNIVWGSGVNSANILTALKGDSTIGTKFTNCVTAADVANVLDEEFMSNSTNLDAFAKVVAANLGTAEAGLTGLDAGYYFVQDEANLDNVQSAKTRYILQVLDQVTIDPKMSVPKVEKKVQDTNDSKGANKTDNGDDYDDDGMKLKDSADYDIGDDVPFTMTATLGDGIENFTKYSITFNDTPSEGLTLPAGLSAFTIVVKSADGQTTFVNGTDYSVNYTSVPAVADNPDTSEDESVDQSFKLNIKFLKMGTNSTAADATDAQKNAGSYLSSELNNAVITVKYNMTLNENAVIGEVGNPNKVYLTFTNNPNSDSDSTENEKGKTPEDKVIVFTYKTVINKVDKNGDALDGAAFALYKVADGYSWTNLDVDANTPMTADKVAAINTQLATDKIQAYTAEVSGTDNNVFTFSGIDDGTYVLVETTTPTGYNTMLPQVFTVSATHDDSWEEQVQTAVLTALNGTKVNGAVNFTTDKAAGSLTEDVVNQAGAILPSTGGIGTTIFYVVGAILVIGAGIVLVTRRRMRA